MIERFETTRLFVGRDAELGRLAVALTKVSFAQVVGLAGVGKSALVAQFASAWSGPALPRRVSVGQRGAELVDELRRALSRPMLQLVSDDERVADLSRLLDREGTLLVIEEADRLDGEGKALLADLIGQLARGRIVATARTQVFPLGEGPERLQLVLEGLERDAAAELWAQLDVLYGVRDGFEEAWRKSRGNPFYLRRVHAGDGGADPLLSDTIASLVHDDRAIALALAVSDMPLSPDVVARVLPDDRGEQALDRLLDCLVAERIGSDQVTLHDLIRSAMLQAASAAELQQAHHQLAAALQGAALDPVVEVRERFRHLVASGQVATARALVLGRASELVRLGGSGELIRCLDLLMADTADVDIRLARARVLGRMLDFRRAFEDLSHMNANRQTATDRVRTSLAHVAMLTARLDVAEKISRAALADPALDQTLRIRHAAIWLFTRTYQGHGEAARVAVTDLTRQIEEPTARGMLMYLQAFSYWIEERDVEAEEAMRRAWVFLAGEQSMRARVLGAMFWVTLLARVGKLEEANREFATVEAAFEHFEDPLIETLMSALRSTLLATRGEFAAALAEITLTARRWSHGGHTLGLYWARRQRGELLLRIGCVREGHELLDEVARDAASAGVQLIAQQCERARRADPRRAVLDDRPRPTRPGEIRRDRVLAVLRAIASGEREVAQARMGLLEEDATLDALERALLELARATLARIDGRGDAPAMLTHAVQLAARAGADPELVVELDRYLRDAGARSHRAQAVVIDRKTHEIRVAGAVVALGSRPTLRRLLYALLVEAGRTFDKASLAVALWSSKYRPERHDSALWVNVKRLRDLLDGTGLSIVTDTLGYRILVLDGYQLVIANDHEPVG